MKYCVVVGRSAIDNRKIVLGEGSSRCGAIQNAQKGWGRMLPSYTIEEFDSQLHADNYMYMLTTTYSYIN